MENVSIGQYRSHDQPKNLAIKVTIKHVTSSYVIPSAQISMITPDQLEQGQEIRMGVLNSTNLDDVEEVIVHWQEKLFSEKEFNYYGDISNCSNSLEQKYNDDINHIKMKFGGRQNYRIFTYVDSDTTTFFDSIENQVTTDENVIGNILIQRSKQQNYSHFKNSLASRGGLRLRKNVINESPNENFKKDHVITTPSKTMYIMADLSSIDSNEIMIEDERVLCTIKINANGNLVVKPDICKKESYTIETNRVTRCIYQYTLEHASPTITKEEQQHETSLRNELYNRHVQLLNSQVGHKVYPNPLDHELHLYCFCEIVSAKNFEYNSLYIQYVLDLPNGWTTPEDNLTGVTQSCSMNTDDEAHFSFPIDFQLFYSPIDMEQGSLKWPVLYLQVFSMDSWQIHRVEGYGYCQVPDVPGTTCVQINMWRPKGDDLMSEVRRFFIGGTKELDNLSYIKDVASQNNKMNRFYFKTVNTGRVIMNFNTCFHSKVNEETSFQPNQNSKWKKVRKRRENALVGAVNSLTHVFDAFHRARKRMLAARSTLPDLT